MHIVGRTNDIKIIIYFASVSFLKSFILDFAMEDGAPT